MATIGIFFGSDTGNTRKIVKSIATKLGDAAAKPVNVEKYDDEEADILGKILSYQYLIFASPTLGDGELPGEASGGQGASWLEFLPILKKADLSGKTIALVGLGDQEGYPDNFVDAIGLIYKAVTKAGATVVGEWPTDGYTYAKSKAEVDGKFVGLVLDQDNQKDLTEGRVDTWLAQVKPKLGL
jgi:flavodoxin I